MFLQFKVTLNLIEANQVSKNYIAIMILWNVLGIISQYNFVKILNIIDTNFFWWYLNWGQCIKKIFLGGGGLTLPSLPYQSLTD